MSNREVLPSWKNDAYSKNWVLASEVTYPPKCFPHFYFIKNKEESADLCALIIDGEFVEEFSILSLDVLNNARMSGNKELLHGVCLENLEVSVSPDLEKIAFPLFDNGKPCLYCDENITERAFEMSGSTQLGFPVCMWFSPDSSKVFIKLTQFNPQISEQQHVVINTQQLDTNNIYCFSGREAEFYGESNGNQKIIFRPGCLLQCVFTTENKALLAYYNVQKECIHMRYSCHTILESDRIQAVHEYSDSSDLWLPNSIFSTSPCKTFVIFCCLKKDTPTIYILDTRALPQSSETVLKSYEQLFVRKLPGLELHSVTWTTEGAKIAYLDNGVPQEVFMPLKKA